MVRRKGQRKKLKCYNHPDKEAVAVYNDVNLCKNCLFDFILTVDKNLNSTRSNFV